MPSHLSFCWGCHPLYLEGVADLQQQAADDSAMNSIITIVLVGIIGIPDILANENIDKLSQ